ncbi:O-antigen ligase family protein [Desertibacillus haloalkaliphilus]|uniref:O-antigen ligase family protein n=1 Tax=Desertibacillus haloalkaliphilus TaxID=1328930 RepID=UPI001C26A488|nr:O-antigen ligase family protein [Desertibacillus haloalkaliphilus]MBU8906551.1 O-antigen ligase family protein [Desertibacillus haloalkaliphilus]
MLDILKKGNEHIEQSGDQKISIALITSFVILTIQFFILVYFELMGTSDASRIQLVSKILVGIAFVYALPSVLKRSKVKFIVIYLIAIFIFLINYSIFPENRLYLKELIFPVFFMSLPAFVYSMSLSEWNILKRVMKKASLIVFIFGATLGSLIISGSLSIGEYSMALSYYMLLPIVIYLDDFLEEFSFSALFFVVSSLLVILALGSRGAILCVVVFFVLKLIRSKSKLNFSRLLYKWITFGGILLLYLFLSYILEFAYNFLLNLGIKSRSIQLFLREDIHLSGRDNIYQNVIREIMDNPLLGIGIGGDRLVSGRGYVHNIFLEILANYGIVLGGILLVVLLLLILKSLFVKDSHKYSMIIIWLSLGLIPLMVSSSYLININFWIFLGLVLNYCFIKRNSKVELTG